MRKVGELMNELGFRKEASFEVKKAFIMHLIKTAYGDPDIVHLEEKSKRRPPKEKVEASPKEPEQMAFDFTETEEEKNKVG